MRPTGYNWLAMPAYLDYAASTPVLPEVLDAMLPWFSAAFGNPASVHRFGQQAEHALETARETIAGLIGAQPREIIFTSGGSESDNLALRGAALAARQARGANHILISPVEHHAVSQTARQLASLHGFELETLPVDEYGRVAPEELARRLRPATALVSIIMANNEIGTLNPIPELAAACRARGIPFHTDAVQGGAHLPLDVRALGADLLSLGAHKFYGPKGVGALYVKSGTPLLPAQTGGGHEFGWRAGTSNVPLIVGMAQAFRIAQENHAAHRARLLPLRERLIGRALADIPDARLTGHPADRLPNHASFAFRGVDGNALLMLLDAAGFACSSGSACKTGMPEPSDVLLALGLPREWALGSLRVTLGRETSAADVERFAGALPQAVAQARAFA